MITGSFVPKRIISTFKRVEFELPCPNRGQIDYLYDDIFYEELECVFVSFPKYHIKIL
jgi:hypothetical protein